VTAPLPLICFAEDVCEALGISRATLKRLRRHGAFPIPEIYPPLDKRPRWSRAAVDAYVEQTQLTRGRLRVVGRSRRAR
jgi:predicted DNA-binding transcriptional regulator AlpA